MRLLQSNHTTPTMAAKYELQDLPKIGDDKNKDPFEFMYQFDNFLDVEDIGVLAGTC